MNFKLKSPVFLQFHTTIFISITKTSIKTSCTPFFLIATNKNLDKNPFFRYNSKQIPQQNFSERNSTMRWRSEEAHV